MSKYILVPFVFLILFTSNAYATDTYGSSELDRPLSTWVAGYNESPDSKVDATTEPEVPIGNTPPFLGEEIGGGHIVFVLDRSCSMNGGMTFSPVYNASGNLISNPNRWQVTQSETANAISALSEENTFDVILYSTTYMVWSNSLQVANAANKSSAISFVYGVIAQGGTYYNNVLNHAFTHSGYANADTIVFMTDGYPADGGSVQNNYPNWIGAKSNEFRFQGFQIGGGNLHAIMAFIDGQPKSSVVLK